MTSQGVEAVSRETTAGVPFFDDDDADQAVSRETPPRETPIAQEAAIAIAITEMPCRMIPPAFLRNSGKQVIIVRQLQ